MSTINKHRFCRRIGCNNFATNEGYCDEHQAFVVKRQCHTAHMQGAYDWQWHKVRTAYIAEHPICEDCNERGITTPAREVHHIKPLEFGGDKTKWNNLVSLCPKCHRQRHLNLQASNFIDTQIKR